MNRLDWKRALLLCAGLTLMAGQAPAEDAREQFETKVRPLLANRCWACHRQTAMGGLRLDGRESILKGGKSGPAVTPEKPGDSLLIQAVTHRHERLRMPPQEKLPDEEIAVLTRWVEQGAYWPPDDKPASAASGKSGYVIEPERRAFWSFQKVKRPEIPAVRTPGWARNNIDRFILARLEKAGLRPVRPADKRALIRRASFDLTGLPPTPEEVDAFVRDPAAGAYEKLIDRLLASPQYGERWGRYWLDVARYSDDTFNSTHDEPYPNSFRYRNWVIQAFNDDMPYDLFVKAQIAGDQLPSADRYRAGLGFFALSPEMQDDRVDALSRGFLGLTVACARCHDHKFDPIPTTDFYSLQGIFHNTRLDEHPLAAKEEVERWKARKEKLAKQQGVVDRFYDSQREQIAEILASQTARYLLAARGLGTSDGLDAETLKRWTAYLDDSKKEHPFLKEWFELTKDAPPDALEKAARRFQDELIAINEEKKRIDEENKITLGLNPGRSKVAGASLKSLNRNKYVLWRDMFEKGSKDSAGFFKTSDGVYYYGKGTLERFLQGPWKEYLENQKRELEAQKKALPEKYPFLQVIADAEKISEQRVHVRGDANNLGQAAPPRFLAVLSPAEPKTFTRGSGRMELAEAIADPSNPLTARVMVNRVWQQHFGRGIVATSSNFGQLGDRPTHPKLLDYMAAHFVENGWSVKGLHREIMLSATYALSAEHDAANAAKDPDNTLLWRFNRRRLDIEALRDAMLFVAGSLDQTPGGKAEPLDKCKRRTVYGFVSRRRLDGTLALFDFPNANSTSDVRLATNVPLQRLYLMNSPFVEAQSQALAERFQGEPASRIRAMYRHAFGRQPDAEELRLGLQYVAGAPWPSYARVLLTSNEFLYID